MPVGVLMTVSEYWRTDVLRLAPFLAKHSKWWPCHAHTVTPKQKILISFDPKWVKSTHSDFHENLIKSVGGVR